MAKLIGNKIVGIVLILFLCYGIIISKLSTCCYVDYP